MASISWQNGTSGDWTTAAGWTSPTLPGPADDVTIDPPGSYTVTLNAAEAIGSLAIGAGGASLALTGNSAALAVSHDLANAGTIEVDRGAAGDGGGKVTVGGTLGNTGTILLGPNDGSLGASATITAGGLVNTGGIALTGGVGANPPLALLTVAAEAPALMTGTYDLQGNSRLQFSGGAVTGIASNASLRESGTVALVALASGTTTNSALAALGSIAGTLDLETGANIGISGSLAVTGTLALDTTSGAGGSALRMDGTINNTGLITIGPENLTLGRSDTLTAAALLNTGGVDLFGGQGASPTQAQLGLSGAAPAALTGSFDLEGDALLQFTSGAITSIAAGAALREGDSSAVVAINSSLTTNSALASLAEIAGELDLDDGASVTTQTSLTIGGTLDLDESGGGGSAVAIAGTLSNSGTITVGPSGSAPAASDTITAAGLANSGAVALTGGDGTGQPQASLILRAAAPATLTGGTSLSGNALLQYGSGAITAIGAGAYLSLGGDAARVAVASATTTNSALSGLGSIAGELDLDGGASLSLAGDLAVSGRLLLDSFDDAALSTIDISGTLTNSGAVFVGPNTTADTVGATASALVNTGQLVLRGAGATEALLTIAGAAPTSLVGDYVLFADSAVRFATGGVTGIAAGAFLGEDASDGGLTLAGVPVANSALSGLADVAGNFDLADDAQLATRTDLTVTAAGGVAVDTAPGSGGSDVSLGGTLLNMGLVALGAGDGSLGASATISATALVNTGTIGLVGGATDSAVLRISGAARNTGSVVIGDGATLDLLGSGVFTQTAGTVTIAGALAGALALDGASRSATVRSAGR